MKRSAPLRRTGGLKRRTPLRGRSDRQRTMDYLHGLWRELLIIRDGRACSAQGQGGIKCGGGLQAHHIYGKGAWPALRYDLDNGLLACRNHHGYWIETAPAMEVGPWMARLVGAPRLARLQLKARASKGRRGSADLAAQQLWLEQQLASARLERAIEEAPGGA